LAGVDDNTFWRLLNRSYPNNGPADWITGWFGQGFGQEPICDKQQRKQRCANPGHVSSDRHNHLSPPYQCDEQMP
jgi:hypothetical protein